MVEEYTKKLEPGLWELCYPRVYDNLPAKFHSPKLAACSLTNAVMSAKTLGLSASSISNQFLVATLCDQHDVPTFFITREVVKAADSTDLPLDMKWVDIPMPHPGLVLMFERGAVKHPTDGEIGFIACGRPKAGMMLDHKYPKAPRARQISGGFVVLTAAHEMPEFPQFDISMSDVKSPTIKDIDRTKITLHETESAIGMHLSEADKDFNQWLAVLAIKLILVMNARPEMISHGKHLRSIKARPDRPARQFWSPNIVGASYKCQQDSGSAQPSGLTKRLHWRRGHFTRQAHGPQFSLRRTIWIEPCLVGVVKPAAAAAL